MTSVIGEPDAGELDKPGPDFAAHDTAPQQIRQRADVGQVRPDVDADEHREHSARPRDERQQPEFVRAIATPAA
jgi:hypothetical protein